MRVVVEEDSPRVQSRNVLHLHTCFREYQSLRRFWDLPRLEQIWQITVLIGLSQHNILGLYPGDQSTHAIVCRRLLITKRFFVQVYACAELSEGLTAAQNTQHDASHLRSGVAVSLHQYLKVSSVIWDEKRITESEVHDTHHLYSAAHLNIHLAV